MLKTGHLTKILWRQQSIEPGATGNTSSEMCVDSLGPKVLEVGEEKHHNQHLESGNVVIAMSKTTVIFDG